MAKKTEKMIEDARKLLVKVGDVVVARRQFPYTTQLIVGKVKKIDENGIKMTGWDDVCVSFYKLATK